MIFNNVFNNIDELEDIKNIAKGDILIVDFGGGFGHENRGVKPVIVIQSTFKNLNSATVLVAPITASPKKVALQSETHIPLFLNKASVAVIELASCIDKCRIMRRIGRLKIEYMYQIDQALRSL